MSGTIRAAGPGVEALNRATATVGPSIIAARAPRVAPAIARLPEAEIHRIDSLKPGKRFRGSDCPPTRCTVSPVRCRSSRSSG